MKKLLLTKVLFFSLFLISIIQINAQNWTWMKGANTIGQPGVYGTMGVPSPLNTPGARVNAVNWTDKKNNQLWLFGGNVTGGVMNDLWRYDITTNEWTWINGDDSINQRAEYAGKGITSPKNIPGARDRFTSWTDMNGNLWMFGGSGFATKQTPFPYPGYLNDLWKYDITANAWIWVNGDTTTNVANVYTNLVTTDSIAKPGARTYTASWADSAGNFWIFGGLGLNGCLNDLWKYDPILNTWTWMKGDSTGNKIGIYGTMGVADSTNKPGSRADAACWYDGNSHTLWLFGGWGYDANNGTAVLNDLWKYDITTNQWTWMGGSTINSQPGVYGTLGVPAPTNFPGARSGARFFCDVTGDLFLYSGSTGTQRFNDLWKYNITTNQWTWINGKNGTNEYGNYGIQGVPASTNIPSSRYGANVWSDYNGDMWVFGGNGFTTGAPAGFLNDLWRLNNYIFTSVSSIKNNNSLILFPNPNKGVFTIRLNKVSDKTIVEVYNSLGQKIASSQTQLLENTINIENQADGIYFIKIIDNNEVSFSKIIKE